MSDDSNDSPALRKAQEALDRRYREDEKFRKQLDEAEKTGNRSWFESLITGFLEGIGLIIGAAISFLVDAFFSSDDSG